MTPYTMQKTNSSLYTSLYREPFHLKSRRVNPPEVEEATSYW